MFRWSSCFLLPLFFLLALRTGRRSDERYCGCCESKHYRRHKAFPLTEVLASLSSLAYGLHVEHALYPDAIASSCEVNSIHFPQAKEVPEVVRHPSAMEPVEFRGFSVGSSPDEISFSVSSMVHHFPPNFADTGTSV